jgi:phage/plasmid-like protein (TIGR03299 family)
MTHNIDMTNNRANIAFLGSRNDVWHKLGQEMISGMTMEQWQAAAGLDWSAVKVPAIADCTAIGFGHRTINDRSFIVRSDNGSMLGYVSGEDEARGYKIVQPHDVLSWFADYIAVDSRFEVDTAMSLKGGALICATAKFNGDSSVLGEAHKARLLMTTSFDASYSTTNNMTMTRVVCNNTLDVALTDKDAFVKTRHSTKFNADKVARELANMAQSIESYKAMAEAMVAVQLTNNDIAAFFRACLDIPMEATREDISTKRANQFEALGESYQKTLQQGTEHNTAWAAFNAVTQYADHDKTTRNGNSPEEARFLSSQFGSGKALKAKAFNLLLPDWNRIAVAA